MRRDLRARPLRTSAWGRTRWLVLAPHPDDETLGAGALIAQAAKAGRLAAVAYLTDGAASHPHADQASRLKLSAVRRREARRALRTLGEHGAPIFLDWPDAAPRPPCSPPFKHATRRLAALCRARAIGAIAVTSRDDPHCDHAAACGLAHAVAGAAGRPVSVFEYHVWSAPLPQQGRVFFTDPMSPGRRHQALARHRSQLTPLQGDGFRLPPALLRMSAIDHLYLRRLPYAP